MIINKEQSCMKSRCKFILIAAATLISVANGKSLKHSKTNFDCHDSTTSKIDYDSDLVINNSNVSTENLLFTFNNKYVLKETKSNPEFCLEISLLIDSTTLGRYSVCYKKQKASKNLIGGGRGYGRSEARKYKGYAFNGLSESTYFSNESSHLNITLFVHGPDSTFMIKTKIISNNSGMTIKSNITKPLIENIKMVNCLTTSKCKLPEI